MLHEARTDFSMLLGLVFLLITGAGTLSVDTYRHRRYCDQWPTYSSRNLKTSDSQKAVV